MKNTEFIKPILKRTESQIHLKECQKEVTLTQVLQAVKDVKQDIQDLQVALSNIRDIIETQDTMENTSQDTDEEEW